MLKSHNQYVNEIFFFSNQVKGDLHGKLMKVTYHRLTHRSRVTHICGSRLTPISSDNGLLPDRRQAIIWNNDGILLFGPLGRNFSEILIEIYIFSFKKMHFKMPSGKSRPFCLGLNVLNRIWDLLQAYGFFQQWPLLLTWFNFNPSMDK